MMAIFLLVISQSGVSHSVRYSLPCFAFAFIIVSRAQLLTRITAPILVWSVVSPVCAFPHFLAYFNEVHGGPRAGHRYLLDANIDWGQSLWYLKDWYDANPAARPLQCDVNTLTPLKYIGLLATSNRIDCEDCVTDDCQYRLAPQPGWYAVSVHRLHSSTECYDVFRDQREPVAMIGYSIYIFHVPNPAHQRNSP
jgi:hypothetical protein